jgi:prolyl-tRNA synthetase
MHHIYRDFMHDVLAIPVFAERKPPHERFAGATETYTLEGIMPDGKALQMGTSHEISQSFAKAFEMTFQSREGQQAYPYLTSWGVTTRMIGAVVMSHGDNKGLILPPKIAPYHVVIVPIFKAETENLVLTKVVELSDTLRKHFRVTVDIDSSTTPGAKFYKWEMKGVPLRIEIGPRDIENNQVVIVDRLEGKKELCSFNDLHATVERKLAELHNKLFERALKRRTEQWVVTDKSLEELGPELAEGGKFYQVGWGGDVEAVNDLKKYHGTIRCILSTKESKTCFHTGKPSIYDIIIAKAY